MKEDNRLGQRIREARKKQGLGVPKIAAVTGLPLSTIYNLEYGVTRNANFRTVALVAHALHLSLDELATGLYDHERAGSV